MSIRALLIFKRLWRSIITLARNVRLTKGRNCFSDNHNELRYSTHSPTYKRQALDSPFHGQAFLCSWKMLQRSVTRFASLFLCEEAMLEGVASLAVMLWETNEQLQWYVNTLLTKPCCISVTTSSCSCLGRVVNPLVPKTRSKCFAIHLIRKTNNSYIYFHIFSAHDKVPFPLTCGSLFKWLYTISLFETFHQAGHLLRCRKGQAT